MIGFLISGNWGPPALVCPRPITIAPMTYKIYLGLGSNLGDRQEHLDAATAALAPAVRVTQRSQMYETVPWGYTDQPAFLNQALEAETELEPKELKKFLKEIEQGLGRKPRFKNGPREIDVDILLIDDLVLNEDRLRGPHPGLHQRAFILTPLGDIAPELRIPGQEKTVQQLLAGLDASGAKPYKA